MRIRQGTRRRDRRAESSDHSGDAPYLSRSSTLVPLRTAPWNLQPLDGFLPEPIIDNPAAGTDPEYEALLALVELKGAQMIGCEFCVDLGSQICANSGFSDEELLWRAVDAVLA